MAKISEYATFREYLLANPYVTKDFPADKRSEQIELEIFDYIFRLVT